MVSSLYIYKYIYIYIYIYMHVWKQVRFISIKDVKISFVTAGD